MHKSASVANHLALTSVAAILPTVRGVANPDQRVSAKQLALALPKHPWRTITWRDGALARIEPHKLGPMWPLRAWAE